MEIAIASLCFRDRNCDEIMETIQFGSEIGFRNIEIAGPLTWDAGSIQWMDRERFRNKLEKAGMKLTGSFFPPIPTISEEKAIESVKYANMVSDFTADMGGKVIVSVGGPRQPRNGFHNTAKGVEKIIEHIEKQGYDLRVCFESLDPEAGKCGSACGKQICMPDDYKQLLDLVPSEKLGINLDVGHLYTAGVDVVEFINFFSDKIFNVHIKDHRGKESVALGKGDIDLALIIKTLSRIGYDGSVALELELQDPENAYEYVKQSYKVMTELL